MLSVYQHWDPLEVCVVGCSHPPEFYSWIKNSHVRDLFEQIARETEEDFQAIIQKLEEFKVKVLRPNLPNPVFDGHGYIPGPMTPRDWMVMIGDTLYEIVNESHRDCYTEIFNYVQAQGTAIKRLTSWPRNYQINGAMVSRIGKDMYFGTNLYDLDLPEYNNLINKEFPNTRNHIVNTGGHGDGVYCPVCPGLIISRQDAPTYEKTFPGWEVVYLPNVSWDAIPEFNTLKQKNNGKWWIPGFEHDQDVVDVVETWLKHWVGYVEETVFDVNMLIIDPKNVMVFNYNKQVFDALDRHGITAHVVPFRHRYFWDGGIHCVTSDLARRGTMQDYFLERA